MKSVPKKAASLTFPKVKISVRFPATASTQDLVLERRRFGRIDSGEDELHWLFRIGFCIIASRRDNEIACSLLACFEECGIGCFNSEGLSRLFCPRLYGIGGYGHGARKPRVLLTVALWCGFGRVKGDGLGSFVVHRLCDIRG